MLDKFKTIFGMEDSEEKTEKLHTQLLEYINQKIQVSEWNGKLWFTINGIPIKEASTDTKNIIKELEELRTTWVAYMETYPSKAKAHLTSIA